MATRIARRPAEHGVILIIVLFLIVLLAVLVLQLQFSMKVERRIAQNRADALATSYDLRSRLEMARLAILRDVPLPPPDESLDTEPTEEMQMALGFKEVTGIELRDASSRLNVNNIVGRGGKPDPDVMRTLENLLSDMDADPTIAEVMVDFIDPDTEGEHETEDALNRPFQNITELALVPGMPRHVLERADPEDPPRLYDLLTVFSRGRININTAPAEILMAMLVDPPNEEAIANIIERRREIPFETVRALYEVKGVSQGMFGGMERLLTTKPSVYIADITATRGDITRTAFAVFERKKDTVHLLFYREQ